MAKRNWDRIRSQKPTETVKYRDVYEDQQLERSSIKETQTMFSRNVLNVCICLFVFALLWFLISLIEMFVGGNDELEHSNDPAYNWVHVNEYYVEDSDESYKLRPDEFENLMTVYKDAQKEAQKKYGKGVDSIDKLSEYQPVEPENPEKYSPKDESATVYVALDESKKEISAAEYESLVANWDSAKEKYDAEMEYYTDLKQRLRNPEDYFSYIKSHYRNVYDFSQYLLEEDYDAKVKEYAEYVKSKKKDAVHESSVPVRPIDWSTIYKADENSEKIEVWNQSKGEKTEQYSLWRSVLDGTEISYDEMNELMTKYDEDMSVYKDASLKHLEQYHPKVYARVISGKRTLSLGFTWIKFLISFGVSGILFGVLYAVLSRNLKAQNLLSDTSDINQYHNDQHVALPEEVQRKYDWFPDVGAHSAVQVSSMISHMALSNKGLKQVELADRAKKDILDENGDVEYFKGEILEDEDGNPIKKIVPMIDEDFMEALFDASGAPNDKKVRMRYDATQIPYNPDGSDRDKLGKYATVADLINSDWEFPLYEPQRPAGAYVVDTAPVNTMVLAIKKYMM